MSLDIESLAIDPVKAEKGTWVSYSGAKFLVARSNNDKAQTLQNELAMANLEILQAGTEASDAKSDEIQLKVLTQHVLLDWSDMTAAGKELKYTPKIGEKYLADPRFKDLKQFIQNVSMNRENYKEKTEAQVAEIVKPTAVS